MGYREQIVAQAKYWAEPGSYHPSAEDFRWICDHAKLNVRPTDAELTDTSGHMSGDMKVGGGTRSWCGIFAVALWNYCGIGAKWTLNPNPINVLHCPGVNWKVVYGKHGYGIRKGDIGYIPKHQHHFIITDVSNTAVCSVDGNQANNCIIEHNVWTRYLSDITAYYTFDV